MDLVTVYDAHPGLAGCPEPIPEFLRLAAKTMCGQRLPISEIIDRLQKSVQSGAFEIHGDFISYGAGKQIYLPIAPPGLFVWQNNWRVVRIER
jgi:hypothetical protein